MPQARKRLVSTEVTPFYHVISRCVRRHFLCGVDPYTGKDYTARKEEIKDRLALLAEVFAVDVCACAIHSTLHPVYPVINPVTFSESESALHCRLSRTLNVTELRTGYTSGPHQRA